MGWNHNISTKHASWDTLGWYWKCQSLTFDLQDYFGQFYLELQEIWLDHAITCNIFELESPNLHQKCILEFSKLVLKMWVVIDQNLHGHLAISTQNSKKPLSTLLLCTDLGQARGVTHTRTCSCFNDCHKMICIKSSCKCHYHAKNAIHTFAKDR